jgi:uncharacterized protein (TIGR02145 family)
MAHFVHLLHTLQGTLNDLEGNFLVNDKGDFIIDHNDNYIELVDEVPPTPPPPPPPWGDPHVAVVGEIDSYSNAYLPTYNYYCYSLTQQIYTASEINFTGYLTGIVFYPRGTCNARTLSVYISPISAAAFQTSESIIVEESSRVMNPTTVTVTADTMLHLPFDTPYYYDGTTNLLLTVQDTTGTYDSSIYFDQYYSDAYQALYLYTDSSPGYSPSESYGMNSMEYKNSIQLLFNNASPQGPIPPDSNYFMFTNRGNDTSVLFRTANENGTVFINDEYAGKFVGDTGATFTIPANATVKVTGLKGFGGYTKCPLLCNDANANLSIDRFDESIASYTDSERRGMFGQNTGIKSITSWAGAENYTTLQTMFYFSTVETVLTWEGLSNVTNMFQAFAYSNLATIPSSWNGLGSVTNMNSAFVSTKLTSLPATWAGLNSIRTLTYAFSTTLIQSIPSSWEGLDYVTDIDHIFQDTTTLTQIPSSWQHLSAVTNMDHAFYNTAITSVPSSWNGLSNVTSMMYTFAKSQLTSIPASWSGLANVTSLRSCFDNTPLSSIPSSWVGLENVTDISYIFNKTSITTLPASWSPLTKVTTMASACSNCASLTTIPSSWQGLGNVTTMSYAFYNCTSLTAIPSSWSGLTSLTNMSYAFYNCTPVTAIPDSWDGLDAVTDMRYTFSHITNLVTGGSTGFEHLAQVAQFAQTFSYCPNWTGPSLAICRYFRERNMTYCPYNWTNTSAFYNSSSSTGYQYVPTDWGGLGQIVYGSVEIDGKTYRTVQIRDKIWLADNLDYQFTGLTIDPTMGYNSYTPIETDVGPRACYLEDETTAKSKNHGLSYNWYAVKYLHDNRATLLPPGWRVPSFTELRELVAYSSKDGTPLGASSGTRLKSKTDWTTGTTGLNYDGFDAKAAGIYRMVGTSEIGPSGIGTNGSMWTSTVQPNSYGSVSMAYALQLLGGSTEARISDGSDSTNTATRFSGGRAVRLVKDVT